MSIAVGLAILFALAFIIFKRPPRIADPALPAPTASPSPMTSGSSAADKLALAMSELEQLPPIDQGGIGKIFAALEGVQRSDKGFKMPDGSVPPPLPEGAPKSVRFGVILVRYQGAQLAPDGAPPREVALDRANKLAELARKDFAAAVKAGDVGSTLDIGTVKRGVLEPATEYKLFTLPVSWTSEVLDTPRGFWIMKRIH